MDVGFPFGAEPADFFVGGVKDTQPFPDVNIDDFNSFVNLDELTDSILSSSSTLPESAWTPSLDADFFGGLNLDPSGVDCANNNAYSFNLNEVPLFATSVDPPMFELPACGS